MKHVPAPRSLAARRGAAALVVVMVLFFIMSLVAAYASRSLIFEQRTSANNYRATSAFEAAEAGLDWALAMLNGGRIDESCASTNDTARDTFRDRYLVADASGNIDARKWVDAGIERPLQASCVRTGSGWDCSCPASSATMLTAPTGDRPAPSFRVGFQAITARPGVFRVTSRGCSSFGSQCYAGAGTAAEAVAEVNAVLALTPSLMRTPVAALMVRGDLHAANSVQLVNTDAATGGTTLDIGGGNVSVNAPNLVLASVPGSPPENSVVADDSALSSLVATDGLSAGDRLFLAIFGMAPQVYRQQAAVVRLTCAGDCGLTLENAAKQFPGRVLWVAGDVDIDAPRTIGTVAAPVVLVVDGDIHLGDAADVTINGLLYSRGANWTNGGGRALVRGAFIAEGAADPVDPSADGDFTITGAPTIVFDADIVAVLKKAQMRHVLDYGSVARAPGSWKDF